MPKFAVPYVLPELLELWHDFHSRSPSERAKAANVSGALKQLERVQSDTEDVAARIVEHLHPGCVVIRDKIVRISDR